MQKNRGFLGLIVLIVIALILAKYFLNFDVFSAADTTRGQETVGYTGQIINTLWRYVATPIVFAWGRIVSPLGHLWWNTFQAFVHWGQQNASTAGR